MRPLRQWLAVRRLEVVPSSLIVLPSGNLDKARIGIVEAVGDFIACPGRGVRPHDCRPGDKVVYSSNVDEYQTRHDGKFDLIEEASVIGRLYG
jgi:co-chaperonin GroES (HSP10)